MNNFVNPSTKANNAEATHAAKPSVQCIAIHYLDFQLSGMGSVPVDPDNPVSAVYAS